MTDAEDAEVKAWREAALTELAKKRDKDYHKGGLLDLDNLLNVWENLALRERKILLTIAFRIWAGQRVHGKLSFEKKDWTFEALEEHLDATVYLACALNDRAEKAFLGSVEEAEADVIDVDWADSAPASR